MATVLFIDDEAPILRAVATWLTRRGHVVLEASTTADARQLVEAHAASLHAVFIDRWLGTESGVDLFRWLVDRYPALRGRIAFVTGDLFDTPALEHEFEIPVFSKPFELKAIEAQIGQWQEGGR